MSAPAAPAPTRQTPKRRRQDLVKALGLGRDTRTYAMAIDPVTGKCLASCLAIGGGAFLRHQANGALLVLHVWRRNLDTGRFIRVSPAGPTLIAKLAKLGIHLDN